MKDEISSLKDELRELSATVHKIQVRNLAVEMNKGWETSWTRLFCIAILMYGTVFVMLYMIGSPRPSIEALIPVAGYFLSTLSLPIVRKWWQNHRSQG